jgi:hypothetical protein
VAPIIIAVQVAPIIGATWTAVVIGATEINSTLTAVVVGATEVIGATWTATVAPIEGFRAGGIYLAGNPEARDFSGLYLNLEPGQG